MANNSLVEQETQNILNAVNNATNTQINSQMNNNVTMAANGETVDMNGNVLNAEANAEVTTQTVPNSMNLNSNSGIKTNNTTIILVLLLGISMILILVGMAIPEKCDMNNLDEQICNNPGLFIIFIGFIGIIVSIIFGGINKNNL